MLLGYKLSDKMASEIGNGKLLLHPEQARSGNEKEIDSTESKVYTANIVRNCAKVQKKAKIRWEDQDKHWATELNK